MIPSEPLANAPVLGGMDFSAAGRLAQLSVERLEAYRYWDVAVGLRGGVHRDRMMRGSRSVASTVEKRRGITRANGWASLAGSSTSLPVPVGRVKGDAIRVLEEWTSTSLVRASFRIAIPEVAP